MGRTSNAKIQCNSLKIRITHFSFFYFLEKFAAIFHSIINWRMDSWTRNVIQNGDAIIFDLGCDKMPKESAEATVAMML